MKKIFTLVAMIILTGSIFAQTPQANNDTVYINSGESVSISVLANDLNIAPGFECMDYLTPYNYETNPYIPASGWLSYSGESFYYESVAGFIGEIKFQYGINDCSLPWGAVVLDSAWVVIIVKNVVLLEGQYWPPSTCNGTDGAATVHPYSGFPPFTYLWNTGAITDTISGITAGNYSVTVTDSLGDFGTFDFQIIDPPLNGTAVITPPYDNGCTGVATVNITGGCPPYTYLWNNGNTTSSQNALCSGIYYVTITDQSTNNFIVSVTIPLFDSNSMCLIANPYCSGTTYNYPAGVNSGTGEPGPNYGCLYSVPNPAWYYLRVDQPGDLILYMHSTPNVDIDFACWGPFTDPNAPCTSQLTASCTSCPNNTSDPLFYPSGNLYDCSYSTSWNETVHINNAQNGQYYIILITNYSNQPTSITFDQTNLNQPGFGTADCNVFPVHVEGIVYNDTNNNQILNPGETGVSGAVIEVQNTGLYFSSSTTGHYDAYMENGTNIVTTHVNSPYVTVNPTDYTITASSTGKDFAVYATPGIEDMDIVLTNVTAARPGFDVLYHLTYHNLGTTITTGMVQFIADSALNYLSSVPPADIFSGDTLKWNYSNLNSFNSNDIAITFHLPDYIPMGDILENIATVTPVINDMTVNNNTDTMNQVVTNSYDPNLKEVLPVGDVTIDQVNSQFNFVYTIHFQNEGTDTAFTVTVSDAISDLLLTPSIQIISSSHPCQLSLYGSGPARFVFNNINLPPKTLNETASQGFVKFSISPVASISVGNIVENTAGIVFDFNTPIITNTVSSYIKAVIVGVEPDQNINSSMSIIPNPNNGNMRIQFSKDFNQAAIVLITDITGRTVYSNYSFMNDATLDVSHLKAGMYFIKCNNGHEASTSKFIIKK